MESDCHTFSSELAITYPSHGYPLWEPDPASFKNVEVGDVGVIRDGYFQRLFNALLPADDPSQHFGVPESYEPLWLNIPIRTSIDQQRVFPRGSPDEEEELQFSCSGKGGLIYLPFPARRFDAIALGDFAMWIRRNINQWFYFANRIGLGVQQMDDIVLVTGCHIARSWIYVAFPGNRGPEQVSFGVDTFSGDGVRLRPGSEGGGHLKLGPSGRNLPENQCIFIRGYKVRRTRYMQLKVLTMSAMERPAPYSTSERQRPRDFRVRHSDTTNDGKDDEDEGADTRTLTGRDESTPEPDTPATAMSLSPVHAQRNPMFPQLELPPVNTIARPASPADKTGSAHSPHPNRLRKLRNYLHTRQDKVSLPEPDRHSLSSKDDVSVDNNNNEECDDRQEDLDDNQSSVYSRKTASQVLLSMSATQILG
ncbi:hypothetical protein BC826DRAFT_973829 [Russula brevipes]|nr:hypothetical protein BC826DRAFT_973829 [Russula brevipes]